MSGIKPFTPFKKVGKSITPKVADDVLDATIIGSTTPAAGAFTILNMGLHVLTYDDSTLSGTPIIIRLQDYAGTYYYAKMYPTASATANAAIDDIGLDVIGITDATLSGTPKVFEIISNSGVSYYVKAYPTISAEVVGSRGITLTPIVHDDTTISGTPRVASVQIGGADYYTKAYPTKA